MHSLWQDFLRSRGAHIETGEVAHFGAPQDELRTAMSGPVLADLSHFALIEASGPQAREFLNNQSTNDVSQLSDGRAMYAGYCSPKGRLLANFLLWQQKPDGPFILQLDAGLRESVHKRLSMYVLRAKVRLAQASEQLTCLGLRGAGAQDLLCSAVGQPAATTMGIARFGEVLVVTLDIDRYEIVLPAAQARALWDALAARARPVGPPVWRWFDIRAGIPWISPRTQDQFVPQMANFDRIGALAYGKGCYPGQEIVARTHYLGRLKRRMYVGHVDGGAGPSGPMPGDELFSVDFGEQSCGMVVNAAPAPDGGWDVLAVVQLESRDQVIHVGSIDGRLLSLFNPPYTLE